MIIYSNNLHWSHISLNCDIVTKLDANTIFDVITLFRKVSIGHLQQMRLENRGRLFLRTPGPLPHETCICSKVETIHSWTCHVYGPFEFRTSLVTSILLYPSFLGGMQVIDVRLSNLKGICNMQNKTPRKRQKGNKTNRNEMDRNKTKQIKTKRKKKSSRIRIPISSKQKSLLNMCNIPSADMMIVNTNKDFTTIHVILSASYPSRYEYAAKSIDADSIIEVLKLVSSK